MVMKVPDRDAGTTGDRGDRDAMQADIAGDLEGGGQDPQPRLARFRVGAALAGNRRRQRRAGGGSGHRGIP